MTLHLTIDLRAVLIGFVLLLVAAGVATPFAISLADDGETAVAVGVPLAAVGTAFTYQGRIEENGVPANGLHDFQFRLYDDLLAANQTAGTGVVSRTAVVTNGLFSVDIDFGPTPFDGNARFLEVRVKLTGAAGGFTLLDPLQALTVVPQAIFAMKAGSALTASSAITATTAQTALTANSVQWPNVANKPAGFADDVDNDTTYTAAPPLALAGTDFGFSTTGCVAEEIWKFNGTTWDCVPDAAVAGSHNHWGEVWTFGAGIPGLSVKNTGSGNSPGIFAESKGGPGGNGAALYAVNTGGGIASFIEATSNEPALAVRNAQDGGTIIRGLDAQYNVIFQVRSSGFPGPLGAALYAANSFTGPNDYAGYFQGNLAYTGTLTDRSDFRLKSGILPLRYGLDEILALKPVSFTMVGDASQTTSPSR